MPSQIYTGSDAGEPQSPFALATPTSSARDDVPDVLLTPRAEATMLTPPTAAAWPFPAGSLEVAAGQQQQQQQQQQQTCVLSPYQQQQSFPPPVLRLSEALAQSSPEFPFLAAPAGAQYAFSATNDGSSVGGSATVVPPWRGASSAAGSADLSTTAESSSARVPEAEKAEFERAPALGSAALPSRGSALHRYGACKPCAFVYQEGCENGVECQFCHLCDPGERKRRKKERLASKRDSREEARRNRQELAASRGSQKR
jgi:hypothetical protein